MGQSLSSVHAASSDRVSRGRHRFPVASDDESQQPLDLSQHPLPPPPAEPTPARPAPMATPPGSEPEYSDAGTKQHEESSVRAASSDDDSHGTHSSPVLCDNEDQQPLPPQAVEPTPMQPAPMAALPSSEPRSSDAGTTQHKELPGNDENKFRRSDESMTPTAGNTEVQENTVKHVEQQVDPRIPVGRGALKKVYNILKEVVFTEQPEARKLASVSDERGHHAADDSLRQAYLETRFKPKKAVFLRGGKRGTTEILPSSVHAASSDDDSHGTHSFPVLCDNEDQQPLPPQAVEPTPMQPAPMAALPSSEPRSSDAGTTQHKEVPGNDENKFRRSDESMTPTAGNTEVQENTVKHVEQQVDPRIPVGRGALKKVFNILKEVVFTEQPEVRKLPSVSDERGHHAADDSLRQAYLETRFKPKKAVFLRGGKRGTTEILPKQSITEMKRGDVWPSHARPHRNQTVPPPQKQTSEPLTSTSLKTAVKDMSNPPVDVPEVDENRNISAVSGSDLAPPSICVYNVRKSPEETPQNSCIEHEGTQLKESITVMKRGGVWPSRARPHRTQTVPPPQKRTSEPLTSTSLKTAVKDISNSPVAVPEVDENRNISAVSGSVLAPPSVCIFDTRDSPEETPLNYCIENDGSQLGTKQNESSCSSLEEKQFLIDMERACQLSLEDNQPHGSKEQITHSPEAVDKPKRVLDDSEDEQDVREACKRSLMDNWSPDPLELDEDPEATVSPLQSEEERGAPFPETLFRYLTEPVKQQKSNPVDLTKVSTTAPSVESKEQKADEEGGLLSPRYEKHCSQSPQPGPSASKTDDKVVHIFPLTEEQQFLRDMETARQFSLQENWKHGMGDGDSSDED